MARCESRDVLDCRDVEAALLARGHAESQSAAAMLMITFEKSKNDSAIH